MGKAPRLGPFGRLQDAHDGFSSLFSTVAPGAREARTRNLEILRCAVAHHSSRFACPGMTSVATTDPTIAPTTKFARIAYEGGHISGLQMRPRSPIPTSSPLPQHQVQAQSHDQDHRLQADGRTLDGGLAVADAGDGGCRPR